MNRLLATLLASAAFATVAPASGTPLGRLFLSPAERAALIADRARGETAPDPAEQPEAAPEAPQQIQLTGVVERSEHPAIAWFNGQPVEHGSLVHGYRLSTQRNSVLLQRSDGLRIRLSVGQSLDLLSGNVLDPLPAGSLVPGEHR